MPNWSGHDSDDCPPDNRGEPSAEPPAGPNVPDEVADQVIREALSGGRRRAATTQADRNLDVLCAFMQTDYSGDLDGRRREGYTRDRETTLLRAARLIQEARKGEPLESFLPKLGDLYGPEE